MLACKHSDLKTKTDSKGHTCHHKNNPPQSSIEPKWRPAEVPASGPEGPKDATSDVLQHGIGTLLRFGGAAIMAATLNGLNTGGHSAHENPSETMTELSAGEYGTPTLSEEQLKEFSEALSQEPGTAHNHETVGESLDAVAASLIDQEDKPGVTVDTDASTGKMSIHAVVDGDDVIELYGMPDGNGYMDVGSGTFTEVAGGFNPQRSVTFTDGSVLHDGGTVRAWTDGPLTPGQVDVVMHDLGVSTDG